MINLIGWLAALVAALTGLAMLQDAKPSPYDRTFRGWARHGIRLSLLICITASSAVLVVMPQAQHASFYEISLRCCLAAFMASNAPCPWWRYVFKGNGHIVERRRTP